MQKFSKTSDGKKGGLFVGKKHSEGGIPAMVVDTGQPIEVEGGEAIINAEATALHWKELSKINQSTGGVPIPEPTQAEKLFEKFENGGKLTVNDKKTIYQKWKSLVNMSYSELLKYYNSKEGKESGLTKSEADSQGISSGRESARWIMKMKKTNYKNWTDTMWRWANKQISFISRMRGNQGELYDDKGRKTRKLMSLLIWGHNPNKYKPGGTIAQTPAPKKERISGSSINKPGSSASINSAKSISFSEDLIETLKNKVKDHNETHPDKKINLSVAKAVVRRGMGAYSSSHRPTISGGKPNSRTAWGLARLNAFLYKIINGESKSGKYSQDNDLIETLGYRYKKYNDGGPVSDDKYIDIGIARLLHEFRNEQEIFDGEIVNRGANDFKIENGIFYIKRPNENWEVFRKIKYVDGGIINNNSFKKWFGNSKVLDKKGNPLIVYHGSPDLRGLKENYIFEPRFLDDYAFFFTDNYSMAKSYADPKRAFDYQNAEEGVIGLYLSLQNPLIVNAYNQIWRKFETTIDENKIIGTRNLIKYAQEKGYDGVIVNNVRDFYNENERRASGGNLYVAFKPEQIKIADGSNNTFDSNNPDIRFDVGGPVKKIEGKNMETKYKDGGYIVKYGKTDKAPGGNTIIRTKTELNDFIEILKQNNHPNIEVFEADSKGKSGKKVLIDEQNKNYTKRDIYNFVLKNSYLQFDGEKEDLEDDIDELTFSTRQNGDVGNEKPGQKDIAEALGMKIQLENEFPKIKTELNYVDEWVMLNIFLPDMENRLKIPQPTYTRPKEEVIDFYFFDRNLPKNFIAEQALINGENLLEELENYSYEVDNDPDRLSTNEIEVKTDNFTIYFFDNTTEFKFGVRYNEKLKNVVDDVATILTNLDPIPTTISGKLRPIHDIAKDIIDLVSDVNRAVETKLKSSKNEISFDLSTYKNPYELNKAIERYLDENVKTFENAKDVILSPEAKAFIKNYSGYGGLNKFGEISVGSMFEFFTPKKVIEKMWALAYKYGYSADGSVLETSVGTGEFLQYANPLSRVVAYEINKYSAMITQILYPFCSVNLEPFEKVFIKNNNTIGNKIESLEKFDLVIGNCPYGDFSILDAKATRYLLGFGEQKFTKAQNYIEYFLRRSIDMLNTNGLLIMIVGAEVRNGAKLFLDSPVSPVKEYLAEHSILLDAYRLPDKTFERTGVTSDIIVLRKK